MLSMLDIPKMLGTAVIVGGLAYFVGNRVGYNNGWNAAVIEVRRMNDEAVKSSNDTANRRIDCIRNGRVWNIETGECGG